MGATSSSEPPKTKEKEYHRFQDLFRSVCDGKPDSKISKENFVNHFPAEAQGLTSRLYDLISASGNGQPVTVDLCSKTLDRIARTTTSSAQVQFYLKLFSKNGEKIAKDDCLELLNTAYYFHSLTSSIKFESTSKDETTLDVITDTILLQAGVDGCAEWIDQNCPDLLTGMHLWLMKKLNGQDISSQSTTLATIPDGCILNGILWWVLSSTFPSMYSQPSNQGSASNQTHAGDKQSWTSLYTSGEHGLSVNRFQHHVFSYRGPTVLLITCEDSYSFALAVDTEWRDGTTSWGGQNCYFVQMSPEFKVLEEGSEMVLFNEKSRNIPKGLFIGRDRAKYSLKVTDGFQLAEFAGQTRNVLDLEVWGCGGSSAKEQQAKQKERERDDVAKNAKVKLPGQWDENPDRLLLQWAGVNPTYGDQFKAEMGPDSKS